MSNKTNTTNLSDAIKEKAIQQYLKNQEYAKRATAKQTLILKKAKAAGIVVTDEEIEEYLINKA